MEISTTRPRPPAPAKPGFAEMSTRPSRPRPPAPAKPGQVKVVRASFNYTAQSSDELSFEEGDTLYIIEAESSKDWLMAKTGNTKGLVPANYVQTSTESIDCPLHEAAKRGNMSFLMECLNNGVSVNGLDKAGSTPIHWAAHGGHVQCIQALLSKPNCQVDVQNKIGDTPLHSAAWRGHAAVVKLLLERGAKADLMNKDGKCPYDLAKDPESAAQLKLAAAPRTLSQDYGDEEDSD